MNTHFTLYIPVINLKSATSKKESFLNFQYVIFHSFESIKISKIFENKKNRTQDRVLQVVL